MRHLCFTFILFLSFNSSVDAKRMSPQPVKSVSKAGLRYEAIHWAPENTKTKQNGGYVRVVNIQSGDPICTKQVYVTTYERNLESDIQDNFITDLKVEGENLVISSEKLAPLRKPIASFCN